MIVGNIKVGCGLLRQNASVEGFEFLAKRTASTVRVNTEDPDSTEMGEDFAFLKLDQGIDSIPPMKLPSSFSELKNEFFDPSATSPGSNELKPTADCRSSGFGVGDGQAGRHFITSDQSPRSGMKAFLYNNSSSAKTLVVSSWGESIEPIRHGDSGGAFYCRATPQSPWILLASIVAFGVRGSVRTGNSYLASTGSDSFLSFWRYLRSEWGQ